MDIAKLKKRAEAGDAESQFELGLHYCADEDNYDATLLWYRKAAEQGFLKAQRRLALIYGNGLKVTRDRARMAHWVRMSAEQGDYNAQVFLSQLYEDGDGLPQDDALAAEWLRKAEAQLEGNE